MVIESTAELIFKKTKRFFILTVGLSVLIFGIALIILPGPAIIVIPLGLVILATEFVWAAKLLKELKRLIGKK
jgi:tellurite resistance protein TerC